MTDVERSRRAVRNIMTYWPSDHATSQAQEAQMEQEIDQSLDALIAAVRAEERDERDREWIAEIMADPVYGDEGLSRMAERASLPLKMHPPTLLFRDMGWVHRDGRWHKEPQT